MATRREPLYGRSLLLWSLPFWLISVGCLVYGVVNNLLLTSLAAAAAVVAFPVSLWRRWNPPGS
jgi:hypothetical protein